MKKKRFKPSDTEKILFGEDVACYKIADCYAYRTVDGGLLHISISHKKRLPTWDEVKEARTLAPDNMTMAMILPPESEYVNIHNFCFHLWETRGILQEPQP